jgi:hypothetical protein
MTEPLRDTYDQLGSTATATADPVGELYDGQEPAEPFIPIDGDGALDEDAERSTHALFAGDEGELNFEQRRTLVLLLKKRYLSAEQYPAEWAYLDDNKLLFRSRLNDLFLDLVIDTERRIAYKKPAVSDTGDTSFPTLLYDTAYTREETIVLIAIRSRYRSARAAGDVDVIIDVEELLQHVQQFRPVHATDHAGDEKVTRSTIEKIRKIGILIKTSDEHRLRISPVIELLLPLPKLKELLEWLTATNTASATGKSAVESGRHLAAEEVEQPELEIDDSEDAS